jgi:hypothetical protein
MPCPNLPKGKRQDRVPLQQRQVRGVTQGLDSRTYHRLAEPLSAPEQELRLPEPKRLCLSSLGIGSTDAAKAQPFVNMIFEGI